METIGKYLRTKRFFKELTLREVVELAKDEYNFSTSTSVLSAVETDKNKVIDGELLLVLSDIYDFDMNDLRNVALNEIKNNGRQTRVSNNK